MGVVVKDELTGVCSSNLSTVSNNDMRRVNITVIKNKL